MLTMPSVRRINRLLWWTAGLSAAAAVAVLIAGVMLPIDARVQASATSQRSAVAATRPSETASSALLQRAWSAPLRQQLDATASTNLAAKAAPSDALPVTLVGTVGTSLAMLQAPGGEVVLAGVGEEAAGVKIVSIRPWQIDVQYRGRALTLHKPKPDEQLN
jgi:hypothetical protein